MNPYLLQNPSLVGVSGGRTSARLWYEIIKAHDGKLPPWVIGCFQNTGDEDGRTLEFVKRLEDEWGVPILWLEYNEVFNIEKYRKKDGTLRDRRQNYNMADPTDWGFKVVTFETASRNGEPFDAMIDYYAQYRAEVKGLPPVLPNVPQRMCTSYLKIKISARYMETLGFKEYDAVLGIRADEPKRYSKMMAANNTTNNRYENVCPLYEAGVVKQDVKDFWGAQSFDLQLDPESDEGNCRYCFLKRKDKLIRIMGKHIAANNGLIPADLLRVVNREKRTGQTFRRDRPDFETLALQAMSSGEVAVDVDEPIIDCYCGEAS